MGGPVDAEVVRLVVVVGEGEGEWRAVASGSD